MWIFLIVTLELIFLFREKLNYFWVLVIIVTLDFELINFFEGEKRGKKMGKRGGKRGENGKIQEKRGKIQEKSSLLR